MNILTCACAAAMLCSWATADFQGLVLDANIVSPGGDIPFRVEFEELPNDEIGAWLVNGAERTRVPKVDVTDDGFVLHWDYYDAKIEATISEIPGDVRHTVAGTWTKRRNATEWATMKLSGTLLWPEAQQAAPVRGDTRSPVAGRWAMQFAQEQERSILLLEGPPPGEAANVLNGTVLTTTGDYRHLQGRLMDDRLVLTTFDAGHVMLFKATLRPDGTLAGDFWSGPSFHDTWTAQKDDRVTLPDPFSLSKFVATPEQLDALSFPDHTGAMRSLSEFAGKPRLFEIWGTWCPNCKDATPLLAELHERYAGKGLSIVSLAFEVTGDPERDRAQVNTYRERFNVPYPMLIAGMRGKEPAQKAFPILDQIRAYPTFIFIDATGKVRAVYTGFTGPAAPREHERLKESFDRLVREMLPG